MEWQKTTFGELKPGDVFLTSESEDRGGYDIVFLRLGTAADVEEHWGGINRDVYRLVYPEREALEALTRRTPIEIKAAFALWDNREKVVEKLDDAIERLKFSFPPNYNLSDVKEAMGIITAALALLQAEKRGGE